MTAPHFHPFPECMGFIRKTSHPIRYFVKYSPSVSTPRSLTVMGVQMLVLPTHRCPGCSFQAHGDRDGCLSACTSRRYRSGHTQADQRKIPVYPQAFRCVTDRHHYRKTASPVDILLPGCLHISKRCVVIDGKRGSVAECQKVRVAQHEKASLAWLRATSILDKSKAKRDRSDVDTVWWNEN